MQCRLQNILYKTEQQQKNDVIPILKTFDQMIKKNNDSLVITVSDYITVYKMNQTYECVDEKYYETLLQ